MTKQKNIKARSTQQKKRKKRKKKETPTEKTQWDQGFAWSHLDLTSCHC
jgi:hypothetical protein